MVPYCSLPCLVSVKVCGQLWTEFAAEHGEALATNATERQNPNKLVVAATFEKANLAFCRIGDYESHALPQLRLSSQHQC